MNNNNNINTKHHQVYKTIRRVVLFCCYIWTPAHPTLTQKQYSLVAQ